MLIQEFISVGLRELGIGGYASLEELRNYVVERTEQDTGRRMKISDRRLREVLSSMVVDEQAMEGYKWNGKEYLKLCGSLRLQD